MKKGLRPLDCEVLNLGDHSNRRPDEEGIKTEPGGSVRGGLCIPTADLMKKGLRLMAGFISSTIIDSNRRPDEEGIKTDPIVDVLRRIDSNRRPDEEGIKTIQSAAPEYVTSIPTADLMKKGLRPITGIFRPAESRFQPQT